MLIGRVLYKNRVMNVLYNPKNNCVYEIFSTIEDILKISYKEIDMDPQGIKLNEVSILVPIIPSKIICVGRNYKEHAKELGNTVPKEPILFFKPPSCLLPHGGKVLYPKISKQVDFEGELALIVKRIIKKISSEEIKRDPEQFFAYTAFLDITARDIQRKDSLWTRSKGFDTFGPLGPWIELGSTEKSLILKTYQNGEIRQNSNTKLMVHKPPQLIEYISEIMTLMPGDIIATGTPSGIGKVEVGDKIKLKVGNLPSLEVEIKKQV